MNTELILEIHRVPSKSGKRAMFYPTINGVRINRTNFARRWAAKELLEYVVRDHGSTEQFARIFGANA